MMVKLTVNVYPDGLDEHQLLTLRDAVYDECTHRSLSQMLPNLAAMTTAEFTSHMTNVVKEAESRFISIPGYTKVPVVPIKPALPPLDDAEMALVETGRHIQAIKHFRERYNSMFKDGVGLKDAKDHVDAYRSKITLGPTKLPTFPRGSQYGY
jgi:ribosomal protein L7/L12